MKFSLRASLRWLYPGLRVKRWILLASISMGLIVTALLLGFGEGIVVSLHRALPLGGTPWIAHALMAGLLALGVLGFGFSILRLVRSMARSLAPRRAARPSTMIYRRRILDRGPRVVAIGGGTGLSTLLRGLKEETSNITAIVTVMDDGGSSGRLRAEVDVLPPGDVRNCILALAEDESRLSRYLQHRFDRPAELAGHSLGNLLLSGLEQATGGFDRAIEAMASVLNTRGRVLPATLAETHLVGTMEDGSRIEGESRIVFDPRSIRTVGLKDPLVQPHPDVLDAIKEADLIILGPGSLYTSLVPNLLVEGIARGVEQAAGEKVLVANLMTQPGETDGYTLKRHLDVLDEYVSLTSFDLLIANAEAPSEAFLSRYRDEAAAPVIDDLGESTEYGMLIVRDRLLGTAEWGGKETVKHNPKKLVRAIVKHTRAFGA